LEISLESPQHQAPNSQMASITHPVVSVSEQVVSKHTGSEQTIPEQTESLSIPETVSEPDFMITSEDELRCCWLNKGWLSMIMNSVHDQPTETFVPPATSTKNQPSSSNLDIQPVAPAKPNVPFPPTLFLDSTILADVCENIFQELNKLVQARNNLVHEESYEKQWRRLRERVDFVMSELQK
jgi:hypothetical protein